MRDTGVVALLLSVLALVAIGFVLKELRVVLLPFFIAIFLAYIFKPLINRLLKKNIPVIVGILIVLALVALLLLGSFLIISSAVGSFIEAAPEYQMKLETIIANISASLQESEFFMEYTKDFVWQDAIQVSSLTAAFTTGVNSFVSLFSNGFLILLYMVFLLAGTGQFTTKIRAAFSAEQAERFCSIIENIDKQVRTYMMTKFIISAATGSLATIAMLLFGVDFAFLWGFLTFLLNFIPNIGSILASIFPILISFLQFDSFGIPIALAIVLIGVQTLMGNVVEPKMMESSLDLSPLLVLLSLIFWGWLWGIWGMVLSVPITAMMKIVLENISPLRPLGVMMSGGSSSTTRISA